MAPDILERIALHTAKRVERFKRERSLDALKKASLYERKPRPFVQAFDGPGPRIIAEIKFASPSEGFLRKGEPSAAEAVRIAEGYLAAGAAAISVLTERHFFAGDPGFLQAVREAHPGAFLLMKDFVIDPYQLELARAVGADAVLLIAALSGGGLASLLRKTEDLGLSALVEVHTREELQAALSARAVIVGVNSRNLRTLKTDLKVARELAGAAKGAVMIAESGLKGRSEIMELSRLGYQGFLIGTSLMKEEDPGLALRRLLS